MWFPLYAVSFISLSLVSERQHEDVISRHSGLVIPFISPVGYPRGQTFNFLLSWFFFLFDNKQFFLSLHWSVYVLMWISCLCSVFLDCGQIEKYPAQLFCWRGWPEDQRALCYSCLVIIITTIFNLNLQAKCSFLAGRRRVFVANTALLYLKNTIFFSSFYFEKIQTNNSEVSRSL